MVRSIGHCTYGQGVGEELRIQGHASGQAIPEWSGCAEGQRGRGNGDAASTAVWLHPEESCGAIVSNEHAHCPCLGSIAHLAQHIKMVYCHWVQQ